MPEGAAAARLKRIVRIAALALAASFTIMTSTAQAQRSQRSQRIIAVGDLHGDLQAWLTIAKASGIMNAEGHWAGGSATLVQLGDISDRGSDTLAIIRSLQQLQKEAPRARGTVHVLLGNH